MPDDIIFNEDSNNVTFFGGEIGILEDPDNISNTNHAKKI